MTTREVLVTDGRSGTSRDAVGYIRGLAAGGFQPVVTVDGSRRPVLLSRYASRHVTVPPVTSEEYAECIRSLLRDQCLVTVGIASEDSLLALGATMPELLDKRQLSVAARAAGLPAPEDLEFPSPDALSDAAEDLPYPIVVKPAVRTFTAFRANDPVDLRSRSLPAGTVVVQPFITGPLHAVSGVMWSGRLHSAAHERWIRLWPLECGLPTAAETSEPDAELEAALEQLMNRYDGVFNAQFVGGHLIDLNLRSFSTIELAVGAGVNLPSIHARLSLGESVRESRARAGVPFRWISGDLKGLRQSVTQGTMEVGAAISALRPQHGTVHPLIRVRDPLPFFGRLLDGYLRPPASS